MDTTTAPADDQEPRCVVCENTIDIWDLPRLACPDCQQWTKRRLDALPAEFANLDSTPATHSGSAMVGSRSRAAGSHALVNLAVVDLTSPASSDSVLMKLHTWAVDWAENGNLDLPDRWDRDDAGAAREPVRALCYWLCWNLDWAFRKHPAIDDFVREIGGVAGQVHAEATGERDERPFWVQCPCGGRIGWKVGRNQYRCPGCGVRYGREEAAALPPARRTVAA